MQDKKIGYDVSIVVPVYKERFDDLEKKSLDRLVSVLGSYPIIFACPESLSLVAYRNRFGQILHKRFPDRYFRSLQGYNELMTSGEFYLAFSDFEFILIYHTDAYVFKDDLLYWVGLAYDYIGAPLYRFDGTANPSEFIGIGNGGFSLRRVSAHLRVLDSFRRVYLRSEAYRWWKKYNWKGRLRYAGYLMRMLSPGGGNSHQGFNRIRVNEDVFWGCLVGRAFDDFHVAPFDDARKFSVEYNIRELVGTEMECLPFGCHKWSSEMLFPYWRGVIG